MSGSSSVGELTIRPRRPSDDSGIVGVYNGREPDSQPRSVPLYAAERTAEAATGGGEVWVAEVGNRIVGYASLGPAWWTGDPGIYSVDVRVTRDASRRGTGSALHDRLLERVRSRSATRLLSWVRSDEPAGLAFARGLDYRETGPELEECRLTVRDADLRQLVIALERVAMFDVELAPLVKLPWRNESFLRRVHRLGAGASDDPADIAEVDRGYVEWQRSVVFAPGIGPETFWVALFGAQPVGLTYLKRLSQTDAENDYTGVHTRWRGRGIATALKLRAIEWAAWQGVRYLHTSSEVENRAMVGVNRRLGYLPGARRREVTRDLSGF